MIRLLPAHRRAERFAALVDAPTTLPTRPVGPDGELAVLVGALRTTAAAAPTPQAQYVAELRARLMAEADTALVPTDPRLVLPQRPRRRPRRLTAAAVALVLIGGSAGVAVAARSSLPGDVLYPVKRGIEQVHERLSFSDAGRGGDLLQQAGARLSEAQSMLGDDARGDTVSPTLQSFRSSAGQGADLLFRNYQANGDDDSVVTVRSFASTSMRTLAHVAKQATASLRPELGRDAQLMADLDQQARVLCSACGAGTPLGIPDGLAPADGDTLDQVLGVPSGATGPQGRSGRTRTSSPSGRPGATADASRPTGPRGSARPSAGSTPGAAATSEPAPTSRPTSGPTSLVTLPDLGGLLGSHPPGTQSPSPTSSTTTKGRGTGHGGTLGGVLGGLLGAPGQDPSTGLTGPLLNQ